MDRGRSRYRKISGKLLIMAGLALLSYPFVTDAWTAVAQESMAREWAETASADPQGSLAETPGGGSPKLIAASVSLGKAAAIRKGSGRGAVARLIIPRIGLDVYVVEGTSRRALRRGPGHMPGTPLPGEKGNSVISGHRVTYSRPFYRLDEMRPGDPVFIETPKGKFEYRVSGSEIVRPHEVRVLKPTLGPTLTLTTCHPRFSAKRRLVLKATMMGAASMPAAEMKEPARASLP